MTYKAKTVFASVSAEDTFELDFPWLASTHIKCMVDGVEEDITGATFTYNKADGTTAVVLASAVTGDEVYFKRQTPLPDLSTAILRDVDSQHGSSLAMGIQPSNLQLVYYLEELEDTLQDGDDVLYTTDVALTDGTYYLGCPGVGGKIKSITSVLSGGAVATNDAVCTYRIGTTAITGGVVTHAVSGSAQGELEVATPSAANVVVPTDGLTVVVSNTPGGSRTAKVTFVIESPVKLA